jgi:class 3 adenylate cyclase
VKQIRRIFERYVHPSVVQELIKDPKALNLGGETKEISVIFADIRGYTRLSESMAPEDVMNLVNRYHEIMCEAIWDEEGTLTAFIGDALMAIFNAPLPQKNHALRAVRAAWKMRLAVAEYQRSQPQEMHVSFGFGVNTGLATVGNVGSQERMQSYTAMGDMVNIAARLQQNVSDNNILMNESTYIQVLRHVLVGKPFQLPVKNKAAPLTVRYLLGVEGLPTL